MYYTLYSLLHLETIVLVVPYKNNHILQTNHELYIVFLLQLYYHTYVLPNQMMLLFRSYMHMTNHHRHMLYMLMVHLIHLHSYKLDSVSYNNHTKTAVYVMMLYT